MSHQKKKRVLRPLVERLRACPARDESISHEVLVESWDRLRNESLNHITKPSPAIMAALVLNDRTLGQLLAGGEYEELLALARLAVERYEQRASPRHRIGNVIVATLKESQ
jgi:hypothetical protein